MKKITKEDIQELEDAVKEMRNSMLREASLSKRQKTASPGLDTWPALNNNNDPYRAYRFGITMAGAPDPQQSTSGPIGGNFVTSSYTNGEDEILNSAAKQMGVSRSSIASKKSVELDDIHKVSPVAKLKRNRYGV